MHYSQKTDAEIDADMLAAEDEHFSASGGLTFDGRKLATSYAHYDVARRVMKLRGDTGTEAALTVVWSCLLGPDEIVTVDSELAFSPSSALARRLRARDDLDIPGNSEKEGELVAVASPIWAGWNIPDDVRPEEPSPNAKKHQGD